MTDFPFVDPDDLTDDELKLQLIATEIDASGDEPLPTYKFRMEKTDSGDPMGFINLRIGFGANTTLYRGHIGYGVDEPFRGHSYASRACRLLLPLARRHGLDPIWITCNPDNIASRKTCEKLGARLVETVIVPKDTEAYRAGAREKCRYSV